jgi:hypothetical protein
VRRLGEGGLAGARVSSQAKRHEDRAGDPLEGLVNLFDLGIVLSVAFLIAALSSLDLSPAALKENESASEQKSNAPPDAVLADPESVRSIEIEPGQRVVGRGEEVGTVYRLRDRRTVIVREPGSDAAP